MTHHIDENRLALYSTRDLDPAELASTAHHLSACPACRARLSEFERLQHIFATFPAEPAVDDLRDLRLRTLQAVDSTARHRRTWRWASASAVAAVVLALLLFRPHSAPTKQTPSIPAQIQTAALPAQSPRPLHSIPAVRHFPHRRVTQPGIKSVSFIASAGPEPTLKITTSDPNVIILLPPDSPDQRTPAHD